MAIQKKKQQLRSDTILEQLRDVGSSTAKSVKNDVFGGIASNMLNDIFSPKKNDIQPGQEINLNQGEEYYPQKQISEVRKPEVILFTAQEANLKREIEGVRTELKKAITEVKQLNSAIVEVEKAVANTPVNSGTYHLSFFERLKALLRAFTREVTESRLWLEASTSKKKKRGYWSMFKKHGTTFGMSSERVIATQAG